MTVYVLVTGLAGDPQKRTSAKGSPYATCSIRSGAGDAAIFVSVIAFGSEADRLLELRKGDAVSIGGRAELRSWTGKDGGERSGLSVVASEVAAARPKPRPAGGNRLAARQQRRPYQTNRTDAGPPLADDPVNDLWQDAL